MYICSICLDQVYDNNNNNNNTCNICNNIFHYNCIQQWIMSCKKNNFLICCPICRSKLKNICHNNELFNNHLQNLLDCLFIEKNIIMISYSYNNNKNIFIIK